MKLSSNGRCRTMSLEPVVGENSSEKQKKPKDRVLQLCELCRGLVFNVVAQYGTTDDPRYVITVKVDGEVFQGVGPSRKRAKTMAAEQALVRLSAINDYETEKPEPETYHRDDYTADVFDSSALFYKFVESAVDNTSAAHSNVTPLMAIDVGYDEDEEYDEFASYVGRNTLSILSELRPDTTYRLVYESRNASRSRFVMTCKVDDQIFRGEAPSKKLAKARAARDALEALYGIQFNIVEDGMPIYEGSGKVWQQYKAKLEKESLKLVGTFAVKNPVAELHELFPEVKYEFADEKVEVGNFFHCKVRVNDVDYNGIGLNKKDAKANAATNALEGLRVSGYLEQRLKEIEAKKQAKVEKLKEYEQSEGRGQAKSRFDQWLRLSKTTARNAVSKLNELYPMLEYILVGEMPMRNACLTAFAVSVTVNDRKYIGIGKNKKLARMNAAEKALRGLGLWNEDDDFMKIYALRGDRQLEAAWKEQSWGDLGSLPPGSGPLPLLRGPVPCSGNRSRSGFSFGFGQRRRGRGAAVSGFGYEFSNAGTKDVQGDGWGEEFIGEDVDYGDSYDVSMINKLSSIVAKLLDRNPNMGFNDIWTILQADDSWQSPGDSWQESCSWWTEEGYQGPWLNYSKTLRRESAVNFDVGNNSDPLFKSNTKVPSLLAATIAPPLMGRSVVPSLLDADVVPSLEAPKRFDRTVIGSSRGFLAPPSRPRNAAIASRGRGASLFSKNDRNPFMNFEQDVVETGFIPDNTSLKRGFRIRGSRPPPPSFRLPTGRGGRGALVVPMDSGCGPSIIR